MLLFGTQMEISTFVFICVEIVLLSLQIIHRLARPGNKHAYYNIVLLSLLIIYNVASGLLPDPNLPGSVILQNCIAYGTGFITPCFFPLYVYRCFGLRSMRWHAFRGVYLFLMLPYFLFVGVYVATGNLEAAKNLLGIPLLYAILVIFALVKSVHQKYSEQNTNPKGKEEMSILLASLVPWVALPVISFLGLSQTFEAIITNTGFLLLMALQLKQYITQSRLEHEKLLTFNAKLEKEVERRTTELKLVSENKTAAFINIAHEAKTPLFLVKSQLEDYMQTAPSSEALESMRQNIDKLTKDVVNFFDLEKAMRGFAIGCKDQTSNFSALVRDRIQLFQHYARKSGISLSGQIVDDIAVAAVPEALDRIVFNLVENALKFTPEGGTILVELERSGDWVQLVVSDNGSGIEPAQRTKVFQPYYQIKRKQAFKATLGLGLGLPITKQVAEQLGGRIEVAEHARLGGTTIIVTLPVSKEEVGRQDAIHASITFQPAVRETAFSETEPQEEGRFTLLIIEDKPSMLRFLYQRFSKKYNVYTAQNGAAALSRLREEGIRPDLIISDVMMDGMDGFQFQRVISQEARFRHIPLLFFSAKTEKGIKLQALKLGAIDFIEKPSSIQVLEEQVHNTLATVHLQKARIVEQIVQSVPLANALGRTPDFTTEMAVAAPVTSPVKQSKPDLADQYNLTRRELEIAHLVVSGKTTKVIADQLFVSEKTVGTHIQNLYKKLGVSSKVALLHKMQEGGSK